MPDREDLSALLPEQLSPSRAKDYKQCPRLFYYKTIRRMRTPNTVHTARGSIAHEAFERVFDHPKGERTMGVALSYVEPAWTRMREDEAYAELVAEGPEFEAALVASAKESVRGWFAMEDPNRFEPAGIEIRVKAELLGVTMHGFIDRFDRVELPDGRVYWAISDYKTGRPPRPRYEDEAFFAMWVYAACAYEMLGIVVDELRLIYVTENRRDAVIKRPVDLRSIEATKRRMDALWKQVKRDAKRGRFEPKTGPLCPYCHFMDICPAFNDGMEGLEVSVEIGPSSSPEPAAAAS